MTNLPKFAEIAAQRISDAGQRDKTINVKIAINTARMMVEAEENTRNDGLSALRDCAAALEALISERPALVGKTAGNTTIGNVLAGARAAVSKMKG